LKLPGKKRFFSVTGGQAENIRDLRQEISEMTEDGFKHHLKDQNDFEVWLRDILHKDNFAEKIKKIHSKKELLAAIDQEIEKDKELGLDHPHLHNRMMARHFVYAFLLGLIIGVLLVLLLK